MMFRCFTHLKRAQSYIKMLIIQLFVSCFLPERVTEDARDSRLI